MFRHPESHDVVGFIIAAYRGAKEIHYRVVDTDAYIVALGVFPKYRTLHYSQDILAIFVNTCFSNNINSIKLAVDKKNNVAIHAYEKFGFKYLETRKFFRFMKLDFQIKNKV